MVICANVLVRKNGNYLMLKRSETKKHLPNIIHTIGGKVERGEDPLTAAKRELKEEAGITANHIKTEAIITEILPKKHSVYKQNWMIFYFSGEYESGVVKQTEEGKLIWLSKQDLQKASLFPSLREVIDIILNPDKGPVFARFTYNDALDIAEKSLEICDR